MHSHLATGSNLDASYSVRCVNQKHELERQSVSTDVGEINYPVCDNFRAPYLSSFKTHCRILSQANADSSIL